MESRSATANALDSSSRRSSASWRARRSLLAHSSLVGRRGPAPADARGWPRAARAPGGRPAGRGCAASASAYGASSGHSTPKPKKPARPRGARRRARADEVLDRGQHAVARRRPRAPPSAGTGSPPAAQPGVAREQAAGVAGQRMAVVGGDRVRVEVVVAAAVRPADVVEQQQRQLGARRPLAERSAAPRAPCRSCGRRRSRPRRAAGSRGSASRLVSRISSSSGCCPASATRPSCGAGSTAPTRAPAPAAQSTSTRVRSPAKAPTSTTERAPGGVEARQHDLRRLRERDAPALGVVRYGSCARSDASGANSRGKPVAPKNQFSIAKRGLGIAGSEPVWCRNSSSKNSASPGSNTGRTIGVSPAASSALRWETW